MVASLNDDMKLLKFTAVSDNHHNWCLIYSGQREVLIQSKCLQLCLLALVEMHHSHSILISYTAVYSSEVLASPQMLQRNDFITLHIPDIAKT